MELIWVRFPIPNDAITANTANAPASAVPSHLILKPFLMENIIDIIILIVLSLLIWGFAWTKEKISRKEGIVMLVLYVVYVIYICMR